MQDFSGRTAVITGGASGIGLGMARAFASRGMQLVLADLDVALLEKAEAAFLQAGTSVVTQVCDVSKLEDVERLAALTLERFGGVHVVCSNAGVGLPTSARNIKLADWEWIINVDLWGPIYTVKTFLPLLEAQGEGHINATSSMAGLISSQMMGAYNVAKHGVVALMAATERELRAKKSGVRASVLCPGPINTNISAHSVDYRPGGGKPKGDSNKAGKLASNIQAALEQGMQPDEVGELVVRAIIEEKFWILTHPHWSKGVQKQLDALIHDQTLTRA
ncbi:MAG: SDR family NAD(P)-dependent oxidoreductase [Gammaproteobacteria bacterium]|jgi:NAD(P)-dependent dehydrogenase (short-subunit alcohol dehydrogenase family)|nr:SDR family NAD(P)-dependent oxidoreductase [Gammaproteobacteria bacterium]MCH1551134.1 SDR family NAD(P)-dependent oxidoreductase [Pseudomonadales bacterium]